MELTVTDVLLDFARVSILLVVGFWLRRKITIFQKYYIPVALIAGVLGLFCGPQVLGKVSPVFLNYSSGIKQWASVLSAIVFSCAFLGLKLEKVSTGAMQTYFLAGSIHQIQIVIGLTLTFGLALVLEGDLPLGFGLLPVMGFYGGHSMAISTGALMEEAGYVAAGADVGATFATIGLLCGIIWGMIVINKAAESGRTTVKMKREEMPKSLLTGYYPPEERKSVGNNVSASATLDPLASQLCMVGFIILCGYVLREGLLKINPFFKNLPLFACCLIFSAIFSICTQKNDKINNMIDRSLVIRISGAALEYMIVATLATTNLSVFAAYAIPLLVVSIGVAIGTYVFCFIVGNRILPKNGQFETEIGIFGQCCGVLATGLLLLKVVDPDFKTNGATNITSSSTLGYTYQLQYSLLFAIMIMTKPVFVYAWSWGLLILFLGLGLFFGKRIQKQESAE